MNAPPKKKPSTTKKAAPRIKNYRSQASMSSIFEAIREALATHKARRVMFDNDASGRMIAIAFQMEINGAMFAYRLPVRFERLRKRVVESYRSIGKSIGGEALDEQTYTTGWATIRDWILAQMALIEAEIVDAEEVFFPYLLEAGNQTTYERFKQQLLLPGNVREGTYRIEESRGGK